MERIDSDKLIENIFIVFKMMGYDKFISKIYTQQQSDVGARPQLIYETSEVEMSEEQLRKINKEFTIIAKEFGYSFVEPI